MISWLARIPIVIYRYGISPFTAGSCRFEPTCSAYAHEALKRHGALRGGALALKRIGRCHPWGGCGFDPVPMQTAIDKQVCHSRSSVSSYRESTRIDPQDRLGRLEDDSLR